MRRFLSKGLIVLMVLVAFASCDNTPVYPGYIVSGSVEQTGDFLDGQSFDPGKFSVTAYDLNGKAIAVDSSAVQLVESKDGKVVAGSEVKVVYGYDHYGNEIADTITVDVSHIKSLEVTGPVAVKNDGEITESDLTVTAIYLDSDNAEQKMVLVPGEYSVIQPTNEATVSPSNPTATETITVKANVGKFNDVAVSTSYSYTVEYEATPVTPDSSITGIKLNEEGKPETFTYANELLAWTYDVAPVPSLANVEVSVTKDNGSNDVVSADKLAGATVRYVVASTRLPYAELTPVETDRVVVELTYNGVSYLTTAFSPAEVKLNIEPKRGFALTEGTVIGTPSLNDFNVYYSVGGSTIGTAVTDIELAYVDEDGKAIAANTEVTEDTVAYVAGTFRGIEGKTAAALDVSPVTVIPEAITDIVLAKDFAAPAAQYYDESSWATATAVPQNPVASYTIVMSDGTEIASTDTAALTAAGLDSITINTAYTLSESAEDVLSKVKAVASTDVGYNAAYATTENGSYYDAFAGADEIYLQVSFEYTYTPAGAEEDTSVTVYGYEPVELAQAYATSIDASLEYQYANDSEEPMYGSEIYPTVRTLNDNGVVDPDFQDYETALLADGSSVPAELPETVGEDAAEYIVYAYLADENGVETMAQAAENLSIGAGQDWIDVSKLSFGLAVDTDTEKEIPAMIGTSVSDYNTENGFSITGWAHAVKEGTADAPEITLQIPLTQVFTATTTIRGTVTYVDETGKEVTENVSFSVKGTAWTEADSPSLTWGTGNNARTEVAEGNLYIGDAYAFGSFDIADVVEHGNDTALDIKFYTVSTDEEGEDGLPQHTGSITAAADTTYTFYISYTDAEGVVHNTVDGDTAMATVELTSTEAPEEPGA